MSLWLKVCVTVTEEEVKGRGRIEAVYIFQLVKLEADIIWREQRGWSSRYSQG